MQNLNGDPLPWLLNPENPSVRYWTLVDILDRPADAPEVQEARAAIIEQPLVKKLFALQHSEGYWGDDEAKPYCQDAQGRWSCGSVSRTWPIEKRNQPSKWITLDALRVLKYAGLV